MVNSTEVNAPSAKKHKVDNLGNNRTSCTSTKKCDKSIDHLAELEVNPWLRIPIGDYHVNDQDEVRMRYFLKGSWQPQNHIFPFTNFGETNWHFNPLWFKDHPSWLEYSIAKDVAFCLCCHICEEVIVEQDSFISKGFSNWKKRQIQTHIGGPGDCLFFVLVDESYDISMKEQMAVVLRYVDKKDCVIEQFLGVEHVPSTTVIAFKAAKDSFFFEIWIKYNKSQGARLRRSQ